MIRCFEMNGLTAGRHASGQAWPSNRYAVLVLCVPHGTDRNPEYGFDVCMTRYSSLPEAPFKAVDDDGLAPSHPGEILREDFLPHYGLSAEMLAQRIGVARSVISDLLAERRAISAELAQKLGALFSNGAHFWSALQRQYDLWAGLVLVPVPIVAGSRRRR